MLEGAIEHGDSLGNAGINTGDVQWMTAGSGIIHQEMPKPVSGDGRVPALGQPSQASKMMKPRTRKLKVKKSR